jgi:hypothetical protein
MGLDGQDFQVGLINSRRIDFWIHSKNFHFQKMQSNTSMLQTICPKLPMRNKAITRDFYVSFLGFEEFGESQYPEYLMLEKDQVELHFFLFPELDPKENYGQVYIRVEGIEAVYQAFLDNLVPIHPNGPLQVKPWEQKEFSILDPDNNLLTFGESV